MFYPSLYWQCACLCINAGNSNTEFDSEDEEEQVDEAEEENDESTTKVKKVAPNYGKISRAISNSQLQGVNISLPDINNSQIDFIPDIEHNDILYSLQAINIVSDDLLDKILENRPFSSVEEFYEKVQPTQKQMIGLIKAGCFDNLYKPKTRYYILNHFLQFLADKEIPLKDKLTSVQLKKALELGFTFADYNDAVRMFKFKQYIKKNQYDAAGKRYVLDIKACLTYFNINIRDSLSLSKGEYSILPYGVIAMKATAFDKIYNTRMDGLLTYLNSEKGRLEYQKILQDNFIKDLKDKYCQGDISRWEMDTLSCYQSKHELAGINETTYHIKNFYELPEYINEGDEIVAIAGTVIDNNKLKHTVSVLTTYGVVDVKFFGKQYIRYNERITVVNPETKKKTVIDESWFKRGNRLIIYGQRRENSFVCKMYREGVHTKMVGFIENIESDGTLQISYSRKKA